MPEIDLKLDKTKKYVVACSFGPDSMALLSIAIECGLQVAVAHVNYRKREAANYEQAELEKFCSQRKIKIYVLDLLKAKHKGNFQGWARKTRYEFFKKVADEEKADAVLVAHQQDDLIETYLMQKERKNYVKNPGISENLYIFGVKILRPLLGYSKQQLKEYDDKHNIPYSIDQSNLSDCYERNRIRHRIVEKMRENERIEIIEKIKGESSTSVQLKTIWSVEEFLKLSYEQTIQLLSFYMEKTNLHADVSRKYVEEIKKALSSKNTCRFEITERVRLEKDYDTVYIVNLERLKAYSFTFSKQLANNIFEIDFSFGTEDRNFSTKNQTYVIRNISKNTTIIIKNYPVHINRAFIDWKMPHYLREVWPAIYDENGNILYVPRYRKVFKDTHKSKFIIHTDYFTNF